MIRTKEPKIAALIVAAGRGTRAGSEMPKQWRHIAGRSIMEWTLAAFEDHPLVAHTMLVLHPDDLDRPDCPLPTATRSITTGGATRNASVKAGLDALAEHALDQVLIHDVARPCVSRALIDRVIDALKDHQAAAPALAVTDALWTGENDRVTGVQDRSGLFRAQTPQGFDMNAISSAHAAFDGPALDDVEVARAAGIDVLITQGDEANLKVTTPDDFDHAARYLETAMTTPDIRTGNGFDVHRFGPGDHVTLCGIDIPHDRALQGHSDADVGLHTITDAIYGALAQGDIGQHFPPSDPQWKGADSHIFLEHACALATEMGFAITHVDCTLICEEPKIGPYTLTMRSKLSEITKISADRISVKATTSERLGFTGRKEGIACMATATLVKT